MIQRIPQTFRADRLHQKGACSCAVAVKCEFLVGGHIYNVRPRVLRKDLFCEVDAVCLIEINIHEDHVKAMLFRQ